MSDPLDQIDSLLADVLAEGWTDESAPAEPAPGRTIAPIALDDAAALYGEPQYPPLPQRDVDWGKSAIDTLDRKAEQKRRNKKASTVATALLGVDGVPAFPIDKEEGKALARRAMDEAGITHDTDDTPGDDEAPVRGLLDIGLLTDLATGRKSALEAAEAAGITVDKVQSSLATALRDVDPREIVKAMGIQAAEQQLKSGALYGVVLSTLVDDMMAGRLGAAAKLDLAKLLATVGKIMPKEDKSVAAGSGFVLNISMGGAPQPVIINAD